MKQEKEKLSFENLPSCAADYIKLIIKKMKWRKKVREDVQAELIAHFEDALRECKTNADREKTAKEIINNFGDAELIAVLARRAKKRCRPLWAKMIIRSFQAIGVLIICFILYCFYVSLGKPTIHINYTQEYINANRPTVDSNANASILYSRMAKVYVEPPKLSTDKELPKNECGNTISTTSRFHDIHSLNELNEEEFAAFNKWIEDNNQTIALFVEASKKPYCWNEQDSNLKNASFFALLLPNLSDIRNAARLSAAKAKLDAYQGNLDGACRDIFSIWNSAGHLLGPRTLVEQLVGVAIEVRSFKSTRDLLTEYNFSQQQLKLLQNNLERLMAKKYYINYQTEHFFKDDFIQRCFTDNGKGNGHAIPSELLQSLYEMNDNTVMKHKYLRHLKFVAISVISADRKDSSEFIDNFYDTAHQYALTTPWQLRQENKSVESLVNNWSWFKKARYMNANMILPAFDKVNLLFHRFNIDGQSLILTLAVLRYQQDNNTLPQTLQQLKYTGYISEISIDPFSGKEIIYRLTKDGFTIYSFGYDFDDDGGKMGVTKEGKPKLWNDEDGDAVFWPIQRN